MIQRTVVSILDAQLFPDLKEKLLVHLSDLFALRGHFLDVRRQGLDFPARFEKNLLDIGQARGQFLRFPVQFIPLLIRLAPQFPLRLDRGLCMAARRRQQVFEDRQGAPELEIDSVEGLLRILRAGIGAQLDQSFESLAAPAAQDRIDRDLGGALGVVTQSLAEKLVDQRRDFVG